MHRRHLLAGARAEGDAVGTHCGLQRPEHAGFVRITVGFGQVRLASAQLGLPVPGSLASRVLARGEPAIRWRTIHVLRRPDGLKFLMRQFFPNHFVVVNMPEPYLDSVARNRNKAMNNIA